MSAGTEALRRPHRRPTEPIRPELVRRAKDTIVHNEGMLLWCATWLQQDLLAPLEAPRSDLQEDCGVET